MRDPERIEPVIRALAALWHANPDLRFGQLVQLIACHPLTEQNRSDLFYVEDEKILAVLKAELAKLGQAVV